MLAAVKSQPTVLWYRTNLQATPRGFWDFTPNMKAGIGIVSPAAAPGSGMGTLPLGVRGCPPAVVVHPC